MSGRAALAGIIALYLAGCDVGHDRTPSGCKSFKIVSSRYDARSQTITMRLDNGLVYESDAEPGTRYPSWPNIQIGPFAKGETVIVCRNNKGGFDIDNSIVGSDIRPFRLLAPKKHSPGA